MELDRSNLLSVLSPSDKALMSGICEEQELPAGHVLFRAGDRVEYAFFPLDSAIASFVVELPDGKAIETALVGREGAVGGIVSEGHLAAFTQAVVVSGGRFLRVRLNRLHKAKALSPPLHGLFARYSDCLLAQIFQAVACNAAHTLEARAAKWLIASADRTGRNEIDTTQEQLASLLGVARGYISQQLGRMRAAGILSTRRGSIVVHDRDRLEELSCDCDRAVREHFEEVLAGVYPGNSQ